MRWLLAALLVGCSIDANVARIPVVVEDAGADTSTRCPQRAGTATMIDLGTFCIDATETTRAQYAAFLASSPTNVAGSACATNAFGPHAEGEGCSAEELDLKRDVDHPVVCVDWCDAAAYCAWAGKRLCGRIGGESEPFDDVGAQNDATKSEWFAACAGQGAPRKYPYGADFVAGRCVDSTVGKTAPVGSRAECHGPPGTAEAAVYDLSGNVYEWVNSCQAGATADPLNQSCLTRGGFFLTADTPEFAWSACAVAAPGTSVRNTKPRGRSDDHIGIRCCAR